MGWLLRSIAKSFGVSPASVAYTADINNTHNHQQSLEFAKNDSLWQVEAL
jgi:hypothetical protein